MGHDDPECNRSVWVNKTEVKTLWLDSDNDLGVDEKFIKSVYVNNLKLTGYVDFGSQCTLIKESVIRGIIPREKWSVNNLPSLKGFGNSYVSAIGKTQISLTIDNVKYMLK